MATIKIFLLHIEKNVVQKTYPKFIFLNMAIISLNCFFF